MLSSSPLAPPLLVASSSASLANSNTVVMPPSPPTPPRGGGGGSVSSSSAAAVNNLLDSTLRRSTYRCNICGKASLHTKRGHVRDITAMFQMTQRQLRSFFTGSVLPTLPLTLEQATVLVRSPPLSLAQSKDKLMTSPGRQYYAMLAHRRAEINNYGLGPESVFLWALMLSQGSWSDTETPPNEVITHQARFNNPQLVASNTRPQQQLPQDEAMLEVERPSDDEDEQDEQEQERNHDDGDGEYEPTSGGKKYPSGDRHHPSSATSSMMEEPATELITTHLQQQMQQQEQQQQQQKPRKKKRKTSDPSAATTPQPANASASATPSLITATNETAAMALMTSATVTEESNINSDEIKPLLVQLPLKFHSRVLLYAAKLLDSVISSPPLHQPPPPTTTATSTVTDLEPPSSSSTAAITASSVQPLAVPIALPAVVQPALPPQQQQKQQQQTTAAHHQPIVVVVPSSSSAVATTATASQQHQPQQAAEDTVVVAAFTTDLPAGPAPSPPLESYM